MLYFFCDPRISSMDISLGLDNFPLIAYFDTRRQWVQVRRDVLDAVDRVGRRGRWILDQEVFALENSLSPFFSGRPVVSCASGLDALELALRGVGVSPGDRVLTTPLSAFATTLAVLRVGAIPVFSDVDESGLIDLDLAWETLRRNPAIRFFLPVHIYGQALASQPLIRIRKDLGVTIIEDCAQALGSWAQQRRAGTTGAVAAVSFYPTKNLGALGDGGAVVFRNRALAEQARWNRDYGQKAKYRHVSLGMNSRLDELQAAILNRAMLPRFAGWNARRAHIAKRYCGEMMNSALRILPSKTASTWHIFPVYVKGNRGSFVDHMKRRGVQTSVHYPTLIPRQPLFHRGKGFETATRLPRAEDIVRREVSLPIHPWMTEREVDRVITASRTWRG